jgi:hypothetical protein
VSEEYASAYHAPVMVEEVMELLKPERGGTFLDGTLGGGGHAEALLARGPDARLIGVDRDPDALAEAGRRLERFGERVRLVRSTRPGEPGVPQYVNEMVQWGAGPRASIYLIMAGKARAILHGRVHVTTDDVVAMAHPVLRHRVLTTFSAEAAGINSDKVIDRLISEVPKNRAAA